MFTILFKMFSPRLWGIWGLFGLMFLAAISVGTTRAQDGIPDNCEYTNAAYYQANVFPRYEPQNQRLMLVDWTTGADVKVIAESLAFTRVIAWSADCRYLATAIGPDESMDTVVWDVTNSTHIGSVADAHGQPHAITWGPNNYLVVETRNGAILWNVPANTQLTLTTSFNDFTARNFSRLRWDAANKQLIVNLAVGGRAVYDLTTGAEVPEAANVTDAVPDEGNGTILIGGKPYQCEPYGPANIHAVYDATHRSIYLEAVDAFPRRGKPAEVVAMLEDDIEVSFFQSRNWSSNCRYFAASLGIVGKDASDTVVWDITNRQRVGTFEDAHEILHPLYWVGNSLVIETRSGAYFWNLADNTRTLLTNEVQFASTGFSDVRNFDNLRYESTRNLFFITPLNEDTALAYDANTGQPVIAEPTPQRTYITPVVEQTLVTHTPVEGLSGFYGTPLAHYNYSFGLYECNGMITSYNAELQQLSIVNVETGAVISTLQGFGWAFSWSPDCKTATGYYSILTRENTAYDNAPLDDFSQDRMSDTVVFWDVMTGYVLKEFSNPYRAGNNSRVYWSPAGDRAIVRTTNGYHIYEPATGNARLLVFTIATDNRFDASMYTDAYVYWDYERGQVLLNGWNAVYAFDMQTGVQRYRFTANDYNNCFYWACRFDVSDDNKLLYVYEYYSVGIWDLDTLEFHQVNIAPKTAYNGDRIAVSPDGRYMVIARNMIRVWDLTNLPEDFEERDPVYNHQGPDARIRSVMFIDNVTIETVSAEGTQRWNIETGELISSE